MDAFVNDVIREATLNGVPAPHAALRCVGSPSPVHRATLVRIAEAAVDYAQPEDAQLALDNFFLTAPVQDQYFVRALYASAELQALRAARFGGHNRLQLVLAAIDTLLAGLNIAEKGGAAGEAVAYRFLVYNGSVRHWGIVRPLLRPGYRRHAAASLQRVADALARAEDADFAWRVRHHVLLAVCCGEAAAEDRAAAGGAAAASTTGSWERATQAALTAAWDLACQAARRAPADGAVARLVEDVIRLATHLNTTAPLGAAAASALSAGVPSGGSGSSGGKGSSGGPSAPFMPGQLYGGPAFLALSDPRSRMTAMLQALWSATAVGVASADEADAMAAVADPTSLLSRARRIRGSDDVRARLVDALNQLSAVALARYAALACPLPAREYLVKQADILPPLPSPRPDSFPVPPEDGEHLGLLSLIAACNGFRDVALAALHGLKALRAPTLRARVLGETAEARLLQSGLSPEDVHQAAGRYIEVPLEVLQALAPTGSGGPGPQPRGGRRRSLGLAALSSVVARRNSAGAFLMLPHGLDAGTTPVPSLAQPAIAQLAANRSVSALKVLRGALQLAQRGGDGAMVELVASAIWNAALPVLGRKNATTVTPVLDAAAGALATIDSSLVALRVRLHLECARSSLAEDAVSVAASHARMAIALDYGGKQPDPAYKMVPSTPASDTGAGSTVSARELSMVPLLEANILPGGGDGRVASLQRPLDREIVPLSRSAALAAATYDEPSDPAELAQVSIGQAARAHDPRHATRLLERAAALLTLAAGTPEEEASSWRRLRSASYASIIDVKVNGSSGDGHTSSAGGPYAPIGGPGAETVGDSHPKTPLAASTEKPTQGLVASAGKQGRPGSRGAQPRATSAERARLAQVQSNSMAALLDSHAAAASQAADAAVVRRHGEEGGARLLILHKLWASVADIAARVGATDIVLQACSVLRSVAWDVRASRDMALSQARADLLLADAAASKVVSLATFKDGAAATRAAEAVASACAEQEKRFRVACVILLTPRPTSSAVAVTSATPCSRGKDSSAFPTPEAVSASGSASALPPASALGPLPSSPGLLSFTPANRWWEGLQLPSLDANANALLKGALFLPIDVGSAADVATDEGQGSDGSSSVQLGPVGSLPGCKPILDDCAALGVIVPGCPLIVSRWKARIISALCRAMKRGVALTAPWLVESAAKRLWNRHLHVWSNNEYSLAVMPLLLAAAADALLCLSAVGSSASELCTKFGAAVARWHEESARRSFVDAALGVPLGAHPYFSIDGAALIDFVPVSAPLATSAVALASAPLHIPLDSPAPDAALLAAVATPLQSSGRALSALNSTVSFVLSQAWTAFHLPHRRALLGVRARGLILKQYGLAATGAPVPPVVADGLVEVPTAVGSAAVLGSKAAGATAVAAPVTRKGGGGAAAALAAPGSTAASASSALRDDASAVATLCELLSIDSAQLTSSASDSGGGNNAPAESTPPALASPALLRAVSMISVPGHPGVPLALQRVALREVYDAIPHAAVELEGALAASVANMVARSPGGPLSDIFAAKSVSNSALLAAAANSTAPLSSRGAAPVSSKPPTATAAKAAGKSLVVASAPVPMQVAIDPPEPPLSIPLCWSIVTDPTLASGLPVSEIAAATGAGANLASASALHAALHEENVRLIAELWARCAHAAGVLALGLTPGGTDADRNMLAVAQRCAAACLALEPSISLARDELGGVFGLRGHSFAAYDLPFPDDAKGSATIKPFRAAFLRSPCGSVVGGIGNGGRASLFQWWSIAESSWGRAVLLLIDAGSQSVSERDELRSVALEHFVSAASWAARVRDTGLLKVAARHAVLAGQPIASAPGRRMRLLSPFRSILQSMSTISDSSRDGMRLRSELYAVALQCLADDSQFSAGLLLAEEAFSALPPSFTGQLWSSRLLFQSKLGRDVTLSLAAMRETTSPELQARLWLGVARTSTLPKDQANAYKQACQCLAGSFNQCYILADYAEWLLAHCFPLQQARDALTAAADILLRVRGSLEAEPATGAGGGGARSAAGLSSAQQSKGAASRLQRAQSGQSLGRSSRVSGGGDSTRHSGTASPHGGVSRTAASTAGPAAELDIASDWPTSFEVAHADLLVRVLVQLGSIAAHGDERLRYALIAASYVELLWNKTQYAVNILAAERAYFSMSEAERQVVDDTFGYEAWLDAQASQGPHALPRSTADWVSFWCAVTASLPTSDDLKGVAGLVGTPLTAPASASASSSVAVTQPPAAGILSASKNTRAAAAASSSKPASGGEAVAVGVLPAAKTASTDRPLSSGGGKNGAVAAPAPGAVARGLAPENASSFGPEVAEYVSLRNAAATVRGVNAPNVISLLSLHCPLMTIQALQWLVRYLCDFGAAARAAPALALWYCVAADLLPQPCMPVLACSLVATAQWADCGGYGSTAVAAWTSALRLVALSEDAERGRYAAQLAVAEMQSMTAGASNAPVQAPNEPNKAHLSPAPQQSRNNLSVLCGAQALSRRSLASTSEVPVRLFWLELSSAFTRAGAVPVAKRLALDAHRHAVGFKDSSSLRRARLVDCEIWMAEGAAQRVVNGASSLLLGGTASDESMPPEEMLQIVTLLSTSLCATRHHSDAVALLTLAARAFERAARPPVVALGTEFPRDIDECRETVDLDSAAACVRCNVLLASTLSGWAASSSVKITDASDAQVMSVNAAWNHAQACLQAASDMSRELGLPPTLLVDTLMAQARLALARWGPRSVAGARASSEPLDSAAAVCEAWAAALLPHAGPPGWTSPAHLAMSGVLAFYAAWQAAAAYADLTTAAFQEAALLSAASRDPVSLYLYRTSKDTSSAAASAAALVQRRVGSARSAAAHAFSLAAACPGRVRAAALAAVGAALLAELRAFVAEEHLVVEEDSRGSYFGVEALEGALWAAPRPRPKLAPAPAPPAPAATDEGPGSGAAASAGKIATGRARSSGPPGNRERSSSIVAPVSSPVPAALASGTKPGAGAGALQPKSTAGAGSVPATVTTSPAPVGAGSHFVGSILASIPIGGGGSYAGMPLLPSDFMPLASDKQPVEPSSAGDPWLRALHLAPPTKSNTAVISSASALETISGLHPEAQLTASALRTKAQAVLSRAVAESVALRDWETATAAAGDLIEALGSQGNGAPVQAAAAVALLQSVVAASELQSLVNDALHSMSRQRVQMRQAEALQAAFVCGSELPARAAAVQFLSSHSLAYRMLDCSRPLDATLSWLAPGTRLLIIQRSPKRNTLYAAVLMRLHPAPQAAAVQAAPAGEAPPGFQPLNGAEAASAEAVTATRNSFSPPDVPVDVPGVSACVSRVNLSEDAAEALRALCHRAGRFRKDFSAAVRAFADAYGASGELTSVSVGNGASPTVVPTALHADPAEAEAVSIVAELAAVLAPLFGAQKSGSSAASADSEGTVLTLAQWLEGPDPVVICAERALSCLPFESLPWIAPARAVTRDISASVLGHRLAVCCGIRAIASLREPPSVGQHAAVGAASSTLASEQHFSALPLNERPYAPVVVHAAASGVVHAIDPMADDDPVAAVQVAARRGAGAFPRRTASQLLRSAQASAVAVPPDVVSHGGKGGKGGGAAAAGTKAAGGSSPRRASNAGAGGGANGAASVSDAAALVQPHDSLLALLEAPVSAGSEAHGHQQEQQVIPSPVLLEALGGWLTPKAGLRADSHVPAPAAWQQLLRSCNVRSIGGAGGGSGSGSSSGGSSSSGGDQLVGGAAVINVCGRLLLGVLQPHHVAGLLMPGCRAALIIDGAQTEASVRREVRTQAAAVAAAAPLSSAGSRDCGEEEAGNASDQCFDGPWDASDPWVVAALFALGGVGTTLHTQWPASATANELLLVASLLRGAAAGSPPLPLAEAVRGLFVHGAPPLPTSAQQQQSQAAPAPQAAAAGAGLGYAPRRSMESLGADADAAAAAAAATAACTPEATLDNSAPQQQQQLRLKDRVRFNPVVYGMPQTALLPL